MMQPEADAIGKLVKHERVDISVAAISVSAKLIGYSHSLDHPFAFYLTTCSQITWSFPTVNRDIATQIDGQL
ncbi:Uncharacterised protein [Yersinia enterocolitica]|jgi:hypothetical protein|nr:Uncharacterised protein [Yersinia enterocolitica]CQD57661.1 Uncharacterised protein [Yersinia enterocolitica]CQH63321.1 Uncharacterised protein [Yersinia enterocolitica]CQJ63233.1 Uncharacterised protein [Yersinia enterocolitica]